MCSAAWRRVAELFDAVMELDPGEREGKIRAEAESDPVLETEVRALVRAARSADKGRFISDPVAATAAALTESLGTERDPQRPAD